MRYETIAAVVIGVVCLALAILGVSMVTSDVIGANITNTTVIARVYVWNTEPNITLVTISPSPIDLTPGNTTTVSCTAYVWDYNGWGDVNFTNATFYHLGTSNGADDNNNHYTNSTGTCTQGGSSTNASCTASFQVWYYANNGTWICNMSISDKGGNATQRIYHFNSTNNASVIINPTIALTTPNEIDYGNLSVTEISNQIATNVTNWGNIPINISVRGYGGTNESLPNVGNLSMICGYGNITVGYERYSPNISAAYSDMINLTNNITQVPNFNLPVRSNDSNYGSDTNSTYWRLQIPLTIGGYCNGTIVFSAVQNS